MKTRARHFAWIACAALGLLAPANMPAAPGALRLSGSFIQYNDELQGWPPETWRAVLDSMKEVRMNTVIVQMLTRENTDGTLHSFIGPAGQPDPTETILSYADANGFRVFLGLYLSNWNHDMLASNFLFETQVRMVAAAQQAWDRYLAGNRHPSFAGWYNPYEPWTANYQPAEVSRLRSFLQGVDAGCRSISGDLPFAISPFINSQRAPPCQVEQLYRQILDQSGIDIVLLQDSVGAQQWETEISGRAGPYFQAFQNACAATGVQLWANVESFQISGGVFTSCDAGRLRKQFEAAAPYVRDYVTFDFVHYMNPVAFLSGWDQLRRDRMRQLYADYKAGFVDADYAPFAGPTLSAGLSDSRLALSWHGLPGDQYQVQFTTNPAAGWAALNAPVMTNGAEFSFVDPDGVQQRTGFYAVQRTARLQVPDSMVWIPPGSFLMGTPADDPNRTANELPQFQAGFTRGFWIGLHEVTQSEYQNLACTNPAAFASDLNNPAERVSWNEAADYCSRLTQRERAAGRLPDGYVYRLPTEAEWEYATRAGSTNWFCFGNDSSTLASYAWYVSSSGSRPHPVALLQPNAWGLKDIHGNVAEWCWDFIANAPTNPVVDFMGPTNGVYRAVRGGGWSFSAANCRSSWRLGYTPLARQSYLGFRVVLVPPGP